VLSRARQQDETTCNATSPHTPPGPGAMHGTARTRTVGSTHGQEWRVQLQGRRARAVSRVLLVLRICYVT
jgi:hypothetical protein